MKPLGHKILVLPIDEKVTQAGIILPESGKKNNKGTVIFLGTSVKENWIGKTAVYNDNCGYTINYQGKDHLMLRCGEKDSDVIAIL